MERKADGHFLIDFLLLLRPSQCENKSLVWLGEKVKVFQRLQLAAENNSMGSKFATGTIGSHLLSSPLVSPRFVSFNFVSSRRGPTRAAKMIIIIIRALIQFNLRELF